MKFSFARRRGPPPAPPPQGIKRNTAPFTLAFEGRSFWQHIVRDPAAAATFDGAMRQVRGARPHAFRAYARP
jgi:hypothetical protein